MNSVMAQPDIADELMFSESFNGENYPISIFVHCCYRIPVIGACELLVGSDVTSNYLIAVISQ